MFFRFLLKFKYLAISVLGVSVLSITFVACPLAAMAENSKILIYGDSLSAAYGLKQQEGWPVLLQNKLSSQHYQYSVINASVSGETSSSGLSRLSDTLAKFKPKIIILELGANDGLRGLSIKEMTANLDAMINESKKANAKVLLVGMKIPPNYGAKYTESFSQTYAQLSEKHQLTLVPFMLENIAAKPGLIQDDGLHPNALGQPMILENVWPKLHLMLNNSMLNKK